MFHLQELRNGKHSLVYLSCPAWIAFYLDHPRGLTVLDAIDRYEPLAEAVLVASSNLGSQCEVVIYLSDILLTLTLRV